MPTLADQISTQMKDAMRAKDKVRLTVLRALKTALTNAAIEKGGLGTALNETESLAVVRKQLKQGEDSFTQFTEAGRAELAAKEEAEIEILKEFLPSPLSEAEIEAIVDAAISETGATSKAQMGQVMKLAQAQADGRADGRVLSGMVAKKLS